MFIITNTLRRLLARFKFAGYSTTSAEAKHEHQRDIPENTNTVEKNSAAGTEEMLENVRINTWNMIFPQEASWATDVQNHGFEIILVGPLYRKNKKIPIWSMVPLKSGKALKDVCRETMGHLDPSGLLKSLEGAAKLSTLEIDHSDFILNLSGILEPGIMVKVDELDPTADKLLYALWYGKPQAVRTLKIRCFGDMVLIDDKTLMLTFCPTPELVSNVRRKDKCPLGLKDFGLQYSWL